MNLPFKFSNEQIELLWNEGARFYTRDNPRKAWSNEEKKDCAMRYLKDYLSDQVRKKLIELINRKG